MDRFSRTKIVRARVRMLKILNLIDDARCFETDRPKRCVSPKGSPTPAATLPKYEAETRRISAGTTEA